MKKPRRKAAKAKATPRKRAPRAKAKAAAPAAQALTPAERFKPRLDWIEKRFTNPRRGKVTKADLAFLKLYRPELWQTPASTPGLLPSPLIKESTKPSAILPVMQSPEEKHSKQLSDGSGQTVPNRFNRQSDLARFLQERFRSQISITISKQTLNDWRAGERLPEVVKDGKVAKAPPFPGKDANDFFPGRECVKWVEDWVVPKYGSSGNGQINGHQDILSLRQNHEIWKMERERAKEDGSYKPVEEFLKWIDRVRETLKTAVLSELEGALMRDLNRLVEELPLTEDQRGPAKARCQLAAQQAVDGVLKTWEREVGKIGDETESQPELI